MLHIALRKKNVCGFYFLITDSITDNTVFCFKIRSQQTRGAKMKQ